MTRPEPDEVVADRTGVVYNESGRDPLDSTVIDNDFPRTQYDGV